MSTLYHDLAVDWTGTGTFDVEQTVGALIPFTVADLAAFTVGNLGVGIPSAEDVSAAALTDPGVSVERGRGAIASQSPPLANEWTFALRNDDGLYSPGNLASALYPNVEIGRRTRYRIRRGASTYPVAMGFLREITPRSGWGAEMVEFRALSQLARLVEKTGYSSQLWGDGTQANGIRTDQALGYILDAAGLSDTSLRAFDVGDTKLNWFVIRPSDDLFQLAIKVWASEGAGARLYDGADGKTTFKRRSAEVVEARSNTAQASFLDTDDGVNPWYTTWTSQSGEPNIINQCSLRHVRRSLDAADAPLWSYGADLVLAAGQAVALPVAPSGDDPIGSVVVPVVTTDYTLSAGSLAGAPTFDRTSGSLVTMTVTAGASGATVSGPAATPSLGIQVRGKLCRIVATTQVTDRGVDTSYSLGRYGPHPFTVPTLGELDLLVAQSLCNGYVTRSQLPRPTAVLEVPLASDLLTAAALGREVADRVQVINDRTRFARQMWIESVKVLGPPQGHAYAELGCEAVFETGYLIWDVGAWGVGRWGV